MKEKAQNWLSNPNNDLYQSQKIRLSKKVLKTTTSTSPPPPPPPPLNPSLQQSRRYFRAEKVTRLRLLFAIEFSHPADRVTRRSVYRSPLKNVISYTPGSGRRRRPWYPRIALKVYLGPYTELKLLAVLWLTVYPPL